MSNDWASAISDSAALNPRRAALLLHALSKADRLWIIAQLDAASRSQVEPLLRELAEFGIPTDADLVESLLRHVDLPLTEQVLPACSSAESVTLYSLAPARWGALVTVLRNEPPTLVMTLLQLEAWPWRHLVADSLRVALPELVADTSRPSPPFTSALLKGVLAKINECEAGERVYKRVAPHGAHTASGAGVGAKPRRLWFSWRNSSGRA